MKMSHSVPPQKQITDRSFTPATDFAMLTLKLNTQGINLRAAHLNVYVINCLFVYFKVCVDHLYGYEN